MVGFFHWIDEQCQSPQVNKEHGKFKACMPVIYSIETPCLKINDIARNYDITRFLVAIIGAAAYAILPKPRLFEYIILFACFGNKIRAVQANKLSIV